MHWAGDGGSVRLVVVLMERGKDEGLRDAKGRTAREGEREGGGEGVGGAFWMSFSDEREQLWLKFCGFKNFLMLGRMLQHLYTSNHPH